MLAERVIQIWCNFSEFQETLFFSSVIITPLITQSFPLLEPQVIFQGSFSTILKRTDLGTIASFQNISLGPYFQYVKKFLSGDVNSLQHEQIFFKF